MAEPHYHTVTWHDSGREPSYPSNPHFPDGIDVKRCRDGDKTCKVMLPYPALRCGAYQVICQRCGMAVVVTTAGRRDDPRSVEVACKKNSR